MHITDTVPLISVVLRTALPKIWSNSKGYRVRDILTYAPDDKPEIVALFGELMLALEIAEGRSQGRKSPVAVAKALHLLAPGFFPIWDKRIALAYRCDYSNLPTEHYIRFMEICQNLAQKLQMVVRPAPGKTCLKVIDEYNYSRFTKGWVS